MKKRGRHVLARVAAANNRHLRIRKALIDREGERGGRTSQTPSETWPAGPVGGVAETSGVIDLS